MLILKKSFNFDDFEDVLAAVKSERQIRLPTKFSQVGRWGIDVTIIQLLLTWARAHAVPEIKSYIEDNDDQGRAAQLSDWGRRLYGVAALYLIKSLVTAQGTPIPKDEYARYCLKLLKAMNDADIHSTDEISTTYPQNSGQVAAQFICLHGSRFEFLNSLYHNASRDDLLSRTDFTFLVKSAIQKIAVYSDFLKLRPGALDSLAYLIFELFQNTNDHAYQTPDGLLIHPNLRAFMIRSHSVLADHEHLSQMQSENPQFNDYLRFCSQQFSEHKSDAQRFLELSIVDGGVGFAQKLTGKKLSDLSLQEEIAATAECFKRGVSSKQSKSRGEGLDNVWKALCELKGFIRLRTGRICLFQTFHNRTPQDQRALSLWTKQALEQACGTAVTIIIPCVPHT